MTAMRLRKHEGTDSLCLALLPCLDDAANRGFIPNLPETVERLVYTTQFPDESNN